MRAWEFWVDRGGTFTDVLALSPKNKLFVHKVLSSNAIDPILEAIEQVIGVPLAQAVSAQAIGSVRLGTTLATNALLEGHGEPVAFMTTKGFKDALKIGYQDRPSLFSLHIEPYQPLYKEVQELDERLSAQGEVLQPLHLPQVEEKLSTLYQKGYRSLAVALLHSPKNPKHEQAVAEIARKIGFSHISVSSELSTLPKWVARAQTTVLNAALTPLMQEYVERMKHSLPGINLLWMQTSGGLHTSEGIQGKDMLFSGPIGGVLGAHQIVGKEGEQVLTFDMGGTSTDYCMVHPHSEPVLEWEIASTRIQSPMIPMESMAVGGCSIVTARGGRLCVGPESAGALPGPACYRLGGPLTLTDCQLLLGRILPGTFPNIVGEDRRQPLDLEAARREVEALAVELYQQSGKRMTPVEIAEGAIQIASEMAAHAMRRSATHRGIDFTKQLLVAYGGASGQYICRVADNLGIERILIPKIASALSAYGIGTAPILERCFTALDQALASLTEKNMIKALLQLERKAQQKIQVQLGEQGARPIFSVKRFAHLRLKQAMTPIAVEYESLSQLYTCFAERYQKLYGYTVTKEEVWVEALSVEAQVGAETEFTLGSEYSPFVHNEQAQEDTQPTWVNHCWQTVPILSLEKIKQTPIEGPALLVDAYHTLVLERGWNASITEEGQISFEKQALSQHHYLSELRGECNPIQLERFHVLFQSIAEQMGDVLRMCAASINIRERLDYSCALFDRKGQLIASAHHIPVHLGSMGASVKALIAEKGQALQVGDAWLMNAPYEGGTHLPDLTVIMPVFLEGRSNPFAFVAARGHHADIGGISPGSMPAGSKHIDEEGVYIQQLKILHGGELDTQAIHRQLIEAPYPARAPQQNIADLKAQVAACFRGAKLLQEIANAIGPETLQHYMEQTLLNGQQEVQQLIPMLKDARFAVEMDQGSTLQVKVTPDSSSQQVLIDFTGTSPQGEHNFHAPLPICHAACLYVFRCLIARDLPLNEGCLWPLKIMVPKQSLLSPQRPKAVAAGNVETSQALVNLLLGALGAQAASQGTMNNLSFGNLQHQYYETICGGAGAGREYDGCDAVHTHMTNSRMTDVEVLESELPIRVMEFSIRPESGGVGRRRGGNGVVRELLFLEEMEVNLISENRNHPPFGLNGGLSGSPGRNIWIPKGKKSKNLPSIAKVLMQAGDRLRVETPGGGGYGLPTNQR